MEREIQCGRQISSKKMLERLSFDVLSIIKSSVRQLMSLVIHAPDKIGAGLSLHGRRIGKRGNVFANGVRLKQVFLELKPLFFMWFCTLDLAVLQN